jgi:hypothetical protein
MMMKTRITTLLLIVFVMALLFGSPGSTAQAARESARRQAPLTQAEIDGLLFVREEEKLAHDVYVVMYARWGLTIFSNISSAETNHMAAVKTLLDRYGLPDPVQGNGIGVFENQDLQSLYNSLIIRGNTSLSEALRVGGAIEEIDILDIERYLATTSHSDITNVYNNLTAGSCNHLRAFVSTYQRKTGETYQPQYLAPDVFQAIINGTY